MRAVSSIANFSENMGVVAPSQLAVSHKKRTDIGGQLYQKVQDLGCYESFKNLFEHYYNQVLFFARKYVDSIETSEEVVNDVFLKLWNKRKDIEIKGSFQSYLFSSIRNKCIDAIRKQNDIQFESDETLNGIESSHSDTMEIIKSNELLQKIERAVDQLPTDRRKVFMLSRNEGLMYKEIAERLNISIKTVETQMGRSLKFLREEFKEELKEFYVN